VIFQVPGGENGWSNVQQAVEGLGSGSGLGSGLGWVVIEVVSDERGVKRCVIVEREKVKEKGKGKEVSREKKVGKTTTKVVLKKTKTKESL
jgi:hypothetical protein